MASQEPTSARLVASLGIAGLLSGLMLVGIYLATLPAIQKNRAEAIKKAAMLVLEDLDPTEIKPMLIKGSELVPYEGEIANAPKGEIVYAGLDANGTLVGYAIPADGAGFQDTIVLIYGFDPNRRVIVGLKILESRETPGLGDKVDFPYFRDQFKALAVDPEVVPTKPGTRTNPNEVDTISGATITSKAVVSIVNKSLTQWLDVLATRPAGQAQN